LALEKEGKITGDLSTKFQEDANVFYFVTSPDPSFAKPVEELNKYNINDLINDIKAKILERSSNGIRGLALIFKEMDENGNHKLDVDDFRWGLKNFGISISVDESTQIL
jgi:hypothetical protein